MGPGPDREKHVLIGGDRVEIPGVGAGDVDVHQQAVGQVKSGELLEIEGVMGGDVFEPRITWCWP